jgi:hypothetical protein
MTSYGLGVDRHAGPVVVEHQDLRLPGANLGTV